MNNADKKVNFRIIELPTYQVLLEKDFDNEGEEDKPLVVMSFYTDGLKASLKFGYKEESERDSYFGKLSDVEAQNFVNNVLKQLETTQD